MAGAEIRSITLSAELASAVDEAVAVGDYTSVSEVVGDALRHWRERRASLGYTAEELRTLIQDGSDSGSGRYTSMEEIKAEARRRLAAGTA